MDDVGLQVCMLQMCVFIYFFLKCGVCALQKRIRRSQHARKETEFLRLKRTRLGLEDFESLKVIGRGAFGEVKTFYLINLEHKSCVQAKCVPRSTRLYFLL